MLQIGRIIEAIASVASVAICHAIDSGAATCASAFDLEHCIVYRGVVGVVGEDASVRSLGKKLSGDVSWYPRKRAETLLDVLN